MPDIVAVTKDEFTDKFWKRNPSFHFSANEMVCPLSLSEVPRAMKGMPLAFVKTDDQFSLVAVLGLKENTNFYVNSEGNWRGNYVPAFYRGYPFLLARNEADDGQMILCFNKDSGLLSDDNTEEPFFDAEGKPTETVGKVTEFLSILQSGKNSLDAICSVLNELELIVPWQLELELEKGKQQVAGLYSISETKLNELSDEDFIKVRQAGALPVIYSQLLSMQGIRDLIQFAQAVSVASAPDELNFDNVEPSQNISFDNI